MSPKYIAWMRNLCRNLVLVCFALSVGTKAQQPGIEEMVSPQLRHLLDAQPVLLKELTNSLSATFSVKRVRLFYFYPNSEEKRAFHIYPDTRSVFINLPQDLLPLDEYLALLYESYNASHEKDFSDIMQRARSGKISRVEFPREILKIEFESVRQVKKKIRGFALDTDGSYYYNRFKKCPDNFEAFFADIKENASTTITNYERQYDELIKPEK